MKFIAALTLTVFIAGCEDAYAGSPYGDVYETDAKITLAAGHAVLTGANGMTLYTFDNDTRGKSNCNGGCADSWPPYAAKAGAKAPADGFSVIKRSDGSGQWAKDGAALYFWAGDSAAGDMTGDGVGGVWHIAK
jgi:predicted lipoprotein with Yx(FWY)xxD motif